MIFRLFLVGTAALLAVSCSKPVQPVRGGSRSSENVIPPPVVENLDALVAVYMNRSCTGCHQGRTPAASLAMFSLESDVQLLKSFAYRHYTMRARVVAAFGERSFAYYPLLKAPAIDPRSGTLETWLHNLTRDGDSISEAERATVTAWFQRGAPLPAAVMDEVYEEIRATLALFLR